jgi:hypothetical protein
VKHGPLPAILYAPRSLCVVSSVPFYDCIMHALHIVGASYEFNGTHTHTHTHTQTHAQTHAHTLCHIS